ncbi:MAG: 50S ribosomal protein L24e [archaeon]|nr:MAG: 50S ribosomal protein L24e [archaeon]
MAKCTFCRKEAEQGRGIYFVTDDGKTFYFCSSKCRRNFKLGRKARKIKWARSK